MRGKVQAARMCKWACGITPAYAGKSVLATAIADLPRDHPRLCGEKNQSKSADQSRLGSPPPMRGKA